MRTAILRSGILLALAAFGASTATAQTELFFATGVDSTGWARAQSNADGHVLIESPQYPRGLWLHLVNEAGEALAGLQVEYQGRPDSLVAIRCVDPASDVQETLVWTRLEGDFLRLTLKPRGSGDLPARLTPIDWQIDPIATSLLEPVDETRLSGWEAVAAFLQKRWQGQTGRAVVQLNTHTVLAVDLGHLESIEMLVDYLQDQVSTSLGEINTSTVQVLLNAQEFKSDLALPEGVIILSTYFVLLFEDPNLEKWVLKALGRREGPITLSEAASLTSLSIYDSSFHSLAGLEHLVALETLFLFNCNITDVSPLAALTNLTWLALIDNQISDATPLVALTNLTALSLSSNQIADVSPLAALTNLTSLGLGDNQIADASPLATLTNLAVLGLEYNKIADVSPLAALTNLTWLTLFGNQIADVSPLATLTDLEWLQMWSNRIADVTPLAALTNLTQLHMSSNRIADVTPLAALTNLEWLQLGRNQIADVSPLAALTNLRQLEMGSNRIADVTPLAALTNLEWLQLGDNQIADVTPLVALTNLHNLQLGDNQIADVTPLVALTNLNLVWLDLSNNRIEDISSLIANTDLDKGYAVHLGGNPLSDQALNEQIPTLQARGVTVFY